MQALDADWSRLQFSPDGNRIALIESVEAGDQVNIYDLRTGKITDLFQGKGGGTGTFLGWHPDSRHVLYIVTTNFTGPSGGLWLVDSETGEITVVANQQIGSTYEAAVSPDGQKVAYYLSGMAQELWVSNIEGTQPGIIYTGQGGYLGALTWSPDGKQIAFMEDGLMLINPDGTSPRQLIKPWTKS